MAVNILDNTKAANGKRINKIIEELKNDLKADTMQEFVMALERIKNGKEEPKIKPLSLYLDLMEMIREQTLTTGLFPSLMHNAEVLYDNMFPLGENTPDFAKMAELFKVMAGENGILIKGFFDPYLFASFYDKMNYLTFIQVVSAQKHAFKLFEALKPHALEIRSFLIDDTAYLTCLMKLVYQLSLSGPDGYGAILQDEMLKFRRSNGMYDVDPVRLAQVEKNVSAASMAVENGKNTLTALERKERDIERMLNDLDEKAKNIVQSAESYLDTKARNARESIDTTIKEYEEAQKKSMSLEKDIFLKQMYSDAESELNKYKSMAKSITATASAEVASLGRDADGVIERLRGAAASERILEFTQKSSHDQELLDKIEKLTLLNDSMIERMGKDFIKDIPVAKEEQSAMPWTPRNTKVKEARPIPPVNPLLDPDIPFARRFELVQREKQRRMAQGELFHEMFDDVITAVMENVNPYLIGPSGCGKTYMVKQIGELLDLQCSDIGYINEEYDILGYVTAMGEYSESNFYWLYKYGGIAFCDELDNGNSKATVKLNSFLSNHSSDSYCFPGGERVDKHPSFRVIAAGNTDGSGADVNYSTRERIEESVLQRMIPIYIDYDNRVEQAILRDYAEWFEFSCAFRKATDRWGEVCGIPAQGIFTTRDAFRLKQYLDNGSFSPQKIIAYEFVQTKEPEYLGFLNEEISKNLKKTDGAYPIYKLFEQEVIRVRNRGKRV